MSPFLAAQKVVLTLFRVLNWLDYLILRPITINMRHSLLNDFLPFYCALFHAVS